MDTMINGTPTAPMSPVEAERRFFAKYGENAGTTWAAVQGFLGKPAPKPTTVQGWIALAESVRDQIADLSYAEDQLFPEGNQAPAPAPAGGNDMARIATAFESIARDFSRMTAALEKLATAPVAPARPTAATKPEIKFGDDGIPVCPKHNRRMKESQYGGWFCTAQDPDMEKGRCVLKVK